MWRINQSLELFSTAYRDVDGQVKVPVRSSLITVIHLKFSSSILKSFFFFFLVFSDPGSVCRVARINGSRSCSCSELQATCWTPPASQPCNHFLSLCPAVCRPVPCAAWNQVTAAHWPIRFYCPTSFSFIYKKNDLLQQVVLLLIDSCGLEY